ncbi:MAG: hypothetical protein RLY20_2660 [Verrucomicrobiota bacterium]|jgi:hypothetical protein
MKTAIRTSSNCNGSILMVTIISGLLVGMVLASYLALVRHQNATVARAQDWNAALGAAEAGVEEALAQLTHVPLTTNINRSANGWQLATVDGVACYRVSSRTVLKGSYDVRFTDTPQPVIYVTGTIVNSALNASLTRSLEVRTTNAPFFNVGMAALMNIKMNGNNIMTDSYISTNSLYSTGGRYAPAKARKNGNVASVNGVIDVGNANINGDLLTGPTGNYSVGANGVLTGSYYNDFNAQYQDVKDPVNLASFLPPTAAMQNQKITTTEGTITYPYAFYGSGNYRMLGFKGAIYVGTNVQVTVYVEGNVSGSDKFFLAPGAKLTFYMKGDNFKASGLVNNGGNTQFLYLGLPSNTSVQFTGNASFTGMIYAPQADFTMNGGGSGGSTTDFSGACVVKSVNMNGDMSFHYDEALSTLGPTIYKAMSWREL